MSDSVDRRGVLPKGSCPDWHVPAMRQRRVVGAHEQAERVEDTVSARKEHKGRDNVLKLRERRDMRHFDFDRRARAMSSKLWTAELF